MMQSSELTVTEVVLRFAADRPVAYRDGKPIGAAQLSADLRQTMALLQECDGEVLITCHGRYNFSVAMLASWLAGKRVILPPNRHPAMLAHIRATRAVALECDDGVMNGGMATGAPVPALAFHLARTQPALTLYTSGSTGTPKSVNKDIGDLFAEAFALKDAMTWPSKPLVASVPPNHLYGLTFSVLLPWVLGIPFTDECPLHADEVAEQLAAVQAGTLVTVPVHLRALLGAPLGRAPLRVVSSAGAMDQQIAEQWYARFGKEILEIYGSSETGVIAYRRQLRDPAWLALTELALETSNTGLLRVASPFIHAGNGAFFQTQDLVEMQDDRRFLLLGRADSIVKIAGKRISLLAVETAVRRCRGVVDAAVTAVPVQGHVRNMAIWAAIAIGDAAEAIDAQSIRSELLPQLDGIEIPRRIVVLHELPREANGKLCRERLLSLFGEEVPA